MSEMLYRSISSSKVRREPVFGNCVFPVRSTPGNAIIDSFHASKRLTESLFEAGFRIVCMWSKLCWKEHEINGRWLYLSCKAM